ncbi:hypothetical protein V1264_002129 [Littorina saxatilis]|uniref:DDE-1 domain-containing protein n=1 Tax=Littorina saxatilis TaxID=31220 RepID=A0AAN9C315_9CAEN
MGIIRSLKAFFRHEIRREIILAIEGSEQVTANVIAKQMSILDAINMLHGAWERVTTQTIKNCWRKGGFCERENEKEDVDDDVETALPLDMAQEEFDRWVGVDDGASIVEPTDENNETIMQNIVTSLRPGTSLDETETETEPESDDEEEPPPPPPTAPEMRALMEKLRSGLQSRGYNMEKFGAFDNEVKDLLWSSTNTQTNIRDFFQAPK